MELSMKIMISVVLWLLSTCVVWVVLHLYDEPQWPTLIYGVIMFCLLAIYLGSLNP